MARTWSEWVCEGRVVATKAAHVCVTIILHTQPTSVVDKLRLRSRCKVVLICSP